MPKHIPDDINAEVVLTHECGLTWRVKHRGPHQRNSTHDIAAIERDDEPDTHTMHLARASLYNALPEYMFHDADRFSGLENSRNENAFADEMEQQRREREHALRFFAPLDALLLKLKLDVRRHTERLVAGGNEVLCDILTDSLDDDLRTNRFVAALRPLLPATRHIRGNRTLLTLALRKVLRDEGLTLTVAEQSLPQHDDVPRYEYRLGGELGDTFAGNDYDAPVVVYRLHFWNDELCDADFLSTLDELEGLRRFAQDWFVGIEQQLRFDIYDANAPAVILADTERHTFLAYNTSL